jgi:hypothetical protein
MTGAIDQGLMGIHGGFERLDRAARAIARDGAAGDVADNLVELTQARNEVRTNVAVIRTANEMIGTLIDELA